MSKTSIPKNYHDLLGLYDTQRAIGIIKTIFQEKLCAALHLKRVTAPLFVLNDSGNFQRSLAVCFERQRPER